MPRQARIDAPGALHHIIVRGIERRKIFRSDYDRRNFLERLSELIPETHTYCFAWALLPNHFHLLLKTGVTPIANLMRRLLTGYARWFNKKCKRHGQLFQNRYKSFTCCRWCIQSNAQSTHSPDCQRPVVRYQQPVSYQTLTELIQCHVNP